MKRILCVCFGNSCRSPMMKALLSQKLKKQDTNAFVDSAGIADKTPTPASDNAKQTMKELGLSLDDHLSKHIREVYLPDFDYILVVDQKTKEAVLSAGALPETVIILNEKNGGVPNPYGEGIEVYRQCAQSISEALEPFVKK